MRDFDPVSLVVAGFLLLLGLAMILEYRNGEKCERMGGQYFCPYKSSCLCLAHGTVLP